MPCWPGQGGATSVQDVLGHVVVVGAGLAGSRAVQELRTQGHTGPVTLLGAEPHLPYDRPPLSKGLLQGVVDDTTLEGELDADVRLSTRATGLRPGTVETSDGDLAYDGLVLATGAVPRSLGAGMTLRTLDDARALRARLVPGARVVVVGAGWIGAEVATAAVGAGCATTVVEAGVAPLALPLGAELGLLTVPWYADAGIELRLGCQVASVEADGVELSDGERLPAEVVVVGIGARPDTGWLEGSGLALDRGVVVDEHLAASWEHVVAVGDCAAWWSRRYGARLRVEHWDDALHAPTVAVATLLGQPAVHDPVPYFWSDQLGHRMQFAGHRDGADHVVRRGEPGSPEGWSAFWLAGGVLRAALVVDRPRDFGAARKLLDAGVAPDPALLADPGVALRSLRT